jgi:tetratricopeptide (TPR) repeat protein
VTSSAGSQDDLAEIHRAAFDLRQTDPSEAVRVLRRLIRQGGDIEPLAHGALAEILLEEFDDADAALHHFQRLLTLAPGIAAGELGLARALARRGESAAAQEAYVRALGAFEGLAESARTAKEDVAEGADEAVLTSLEIAVEERELCRTDRGLEPCTMPSAALFDWAESSRLFDDPDDAADTDDWMRFTHLRAELAALDGQEAAAMDHVERIGRLARLTEAAQARIRSQALETVGNLPRAAEEALRGISAPGGGFVPEEWLRCAALLSETHRVPDARRVIEDLRTRTALEDLPPEVRQELLDVTSQHLQELSSGGLVHLGRARS